MKVDNGTEEVSYHHITTHGYPGPGGEAAVLLCQRRRDPVQRRAAGCKSAGAAGRAGVAVALAVLVHLEFQHLLFRDIVRHHALGGALGGQFGQVVVGSAGADVVLFQHIDQLGERGGNPDAGFVLDTLVALF